jgi:hypothetical protein
VKIRKRFIQPSQSTVRISGAAVRDLLPVDAPDFG